MSDHVTWDEATFLDYWRDLDDDGRGLVEAVVSALAHDADGRLSARLNQLQSQQFATHNAWRRAVWGAIAH